MKTELQNLINGVSEQVRVNVTYVSIVKLSGGKNGNTLNANGAVVTKVTTLTNAVYNKSYSALVNEEKAKEGQATDFQSQGRKWGVYTIPNKLIEHNGNEYLPIYQDSETTASKPIYYVNGNLPTPSEQAIIDQYKPKSKPIATQTASGLTDPSKQIRECDINVENILAIEVIGADLQYTA